MLVAADPLLVSFLIVVGCCLLCVGRLFVVVCVGVCCLLCVLFDACC